jgi:ABC-type sugar transport system ATPase subunit
MIPTEELICARRLTKSFPGVLALSDVSLDLMKGELHCVVGENGAGKSTLIKIISGAFPPDRGEIVVRGHHYDSLTPAIARRLGIATIYQENVLVPQLSAAENIFLGREKRNRFKLFAPRETLRRAEEIVDAYGLRIPVGALVEELQPSEQQFVKILAALQSTPAILIMDEPTAVLDIERIRGLLALIAKVKKEGLGIIYISHHMEETLDIADRITVLKDGEVVQCHDCRTEAITVDLLTKEMIGRPLNKFFVKEKSPIGETAMTVTDLLLRKGQKPLSFTLRAGEILGIAGMGGSGRSRIVRGIFGAEPRAGGSVLVRGRKIPANSPSTAIRNGIGLLTEDRKKSGLCLNRSIRENVSLVGIRRFGRFFMNLRKESTLVKALADRLAVKTPSLAQEVRFLSGGNQQKVVLAKWLFKDVDILLFDEPTIGIDVNTKTEIYRLMSELVARGKSIIMVSSEMPELISLCDRVLVIKKGELSAVLTGDQITEENILINSIGGPR